MARTLRRRSKRTRCSATDAVDASGSDDGLLGLVSRCECHCDLRCCELGMNRRVENNTSHLGDIGKAFFHAANYLTRMYTNPDVIDARTEQHRYLVDNCPLYCLRKIEWPNIENKLRGFDELGGSEEFRWCK